MKPKLTIGAAVLISLVLVIFGLVYGSASGYADDRAHVEALLEGDSGLTTVLGYRASDGLNLCVVADRHLTGDADVATLRAAAETIRKGGLGLKTLKTEDENLAAAFSAVAQKLDATVTQNDRDRQYLAMLIADFDQYGENEIYAAYNKAAVEFNERLNVPVLGNIAGFFGVKPCELYE